MIYNRKLRYPYYRDSCNNIGSNMKSVLVAGGAGYIGSQTCKLLAAAGYLPVTIDNLSTGYRQAVRWGPLIEADLRSAEAVAEAVATYDVVAAMHFAAFSLVGESVRDPIKYFENNVSAASRFAGHLVEHGVDKLIFSSTAAVYGTPAVDLIPEHHAKAPVNPYGASKLAFEQALHWIGQAHGLKHVILRYFNAAGADPDGEVGESHEPESHLIPLLCKAVLGTGQPLTVFGNDYPTEDGTAKRDYIHVVDLADAHVLALRALLEGAGSEIYNVGTGEGATVAQVIASAEATLEQPVPHAIGPRRAGDPPILVADARRLREALGWAPRHSDLATILRTAMDWQRSRPY